MVPRIEHVRRKVKAKFNWLTQTYWDAWKLSFDEDAPLRFDPKSRMHLNQLHQRAPDRTGPFEHEPKHSKKTDDQLRYIDLVAALERVPAPPSRRRNKHGMWTGQLSSQVIYLRWPRAGGSDAPHTSFLRWPKAGAATADAARTHVFRRPRASRDYFCVCASGGQI
jgi:hypothetical protein